MVKRFHILTAPPQTALSVSTPMCSGTTMRHPVSSMGTLVRATCMSCGDDSLWIRIPERYNYDPTVAFDYSTYPVARFVNEFG